MPGGSQRRLKTDGVDLNRCRPQREDRRTGVARVTVEIDEDRDAILADSLRDARHRFAAHVAKMLESAFYALADRAHVAGEDAVAEELQAAPVEALPQLHHQRDCRVGTEVGGRETDPQALAFRERNFRPARRRCRCQPARKASSRDELVARCGRHRQEREWVEISVCVVAACVQQTGDVCVQV